MKFAFANEADHILADLSLKDYVVTSHNNEDIKKRNNGSRIFHETPYHNVIKALHIKILLI